MRGLVMSHVETIARNLARVQERIAHACQRAGRATDEVTLVCVSKTVEADAVRAAHAAGARDFGENYGQELRDKAATLADLGEMSWHFIGALQRNKVKYAVGVAALIHSVDSEALLEEIDRRARSAGITQDVLIQLNLAGEVTKSGIDEGELPVILESLGRYPACRCVGLMTMPPFFDEPDRARPIFTRLRALRDEQARRALPNVELNHLSMGMSGDFEAAIEEGATLVRVGTAIFGARG
jgi:PLP dependent protein